MAFLLARPLSPSAPQAGGGHRDVPVSFPMSESITNDDVVGISHKDHFSFTLFAYSSLNPEIEHIMQVDVGNIEVLSHLPEGEASTVG